MVMKYCNSISTKSKTHSCELEKGHAGRCRAESFEGGYTFWNKPEGWDEDKVEKETKDD